MALEPEVIEKVNKRLLEPFDGQPVKKTDVGILFGCRSASGTVAREAAFLYESGAFPKIMVAGGMKARQVEVWLALNEEQRKAASLCDFFNLSREANYMRSVLIDEGVPADDIIIGDDTQKHGHKIAEALKAKLDGKFRSATVMAYLPYSRRNLGSLRFQGVDIPIDVQGVKPFNLTPENWHESKVAPYVVQEANNMDPDNPDGYVGKYTTEVDLDEEARQRTQLQNLEF